MYLTGQANITGVSLEISVSYYHVSNERVERVNKTLREMRKKSGKTYEKLVQAVNI